MAKKIVFHDPIHKEILIDKSKDEELMILELIETFAFQRLRRIKQLGTASLVFHGAEASRFTHSLGVFNVARKFYKKLIEENITFKKHKFVLFGAALLHDLGHGPFSHTSEKIFCHSHESWSRKLIQEYVPIKSILDNYGDNTANTIANLFSSKNLLSHPVKTLISSEIDCDRMDYLLRDSYNTGTKYGLVDLERIISALTFAPDSSIAIKPKGVIAIEHFLVLRNMMYRTIYNHRINEICTWILEKIISHIRSEYDTGIWIDQSLKKWIFSPENLDFEDFLNNDDITLSYHLNVWKEQAPDPLSTLSKMLLNRKLLKASDISILDNIQKLELLAFAKQKCEENNYDPNLFCGLKEKAFKGFESNNSLKIWDGNLLINLGESSPLVKALMKSQKSCLLIYPEEIRTLVQKKMTDIKGN